MPLRPSFLLRHFVAVLIASFFVATHVEAAPREVRIGVYANEPKIFSGVDGMPDGIFGDLARALAEQEGWTLQPVACEWQACLDALKNGTIDLMPDVAHSESRATTYDFHRTPALHSWSQIYWRSDSRINSILDLQDKRLAVLEGSSQADYLATLLPPFGLRTTLVPVRSLADGFAMAAGGTVDGVVANRFFGELHAPRYRLTATPLLFQPSKLHFATGKGRNADLLAAIDRHLESWQANADSAYFAILTRWIGSQPQARISPIVWWTLGGLVALLALALGGTALLRRQVAEKTRHLKASEDKLAAILDGVEAFIYIKDPELRYQYVNRKVCQLFDRQPAEIIGRQDKDFFDQATADTLRINDLRVLKNGERVDAEETNRSADGKLVRTFLSAKIPLRQASGDIYALCGISTDITERKKSEEAIHTLAFFDPLTQLPNRRLLIDRLQQQLAASARTGYSGALLFIDLDNFKDLNDSLGHDTGDLLLQQVAARLSECSRESDTLARLGGDEFVLLLNGLSDETSEAVQQAEVAANKIMAALLAPYDLKGTRYQNTASIGVAMFSDPESTHEDLIKQADLAMYQAKAAGRNTVRFFNPEMQAAVSRRAALAADLHVALNDGNFLLHYQPQVDHYGALLGAEALVRWQPPGGPMIPPGDFIPVAEETGMILPLGHWILHEACRQLAEWGKHPDTAGLIMSINVSVRQLHHPDFVADVMLALDQTGANPQRLEIEITESQLIDDLDSVIEKMKQLQTLGVRFSLDDFGTGYSSLGVLKRLPLAQLKIDQSFVRDLLTDTDDAAIVRTIIALGASLELDVIAEGVETLEQRDILVQMGCHHLQGFYFARPGPAAALLSMLAPANA